MCLRQPCSVLVPRSGKVISRNASSARALPSTCSHRTAARFNWHRLYQADKLIRSKLRATTLARNEPTSSSADAAYIRRPLVSGDIINHSSAVVVAGDIPEGCTIIAAGDVVVLGWLRGEVQAGSGSNREAAVTAFQRSASAKISIAGVAAPQKAGVGQMAVLEPGASAVTFKAMPGSEALVTTTGPAVEAGQVGTALVLALGLGLALAPGLVLGTLLHSGAETITAALLEVAVYGYILLQGAQLLGDGSELLLEILNPGIIGGVVLPVLGAVPDSLIILNAGLHAAPEDAQQEVAVGVGTLAGSTILLLSLAWGGSILLGRCDLDEKGNAKDRTLTRGWDLARTGVTVEDAVPNGAIIMAISVVGYAFVQVPAVLGSPDDPTAALIGSVTCLAAAVGYCVYSVIYPERQKRLIEAARKKRFRQYAVKALTLQASNSDNVKYGGLVDAGGALNIKAADALFDEFDTDKSGVMEKSELTGLLMGMNLQASFTDISLGTVDDNIQYIAEEFDTDKDGFCTRDEFRRALSKWVSEHHEPEAAPLKIDPKLAQFKNMPAEDLAALQALAQEMASQPEEQDEEEERGPPMSTSQIALQASLKLGAGVALCAVFSDPLVDALNNLSKCTGIAPFFVGFVLTPFASNASEILSSLQFATRQRKKNMSLTFSQVYGAVTMNNTLVLGLFLYVVYLQKLEWVYSSEVLVIVGASLLVGFLGSQSTTAKSFEGVGALALYPASLALIYVLDTYFGWQ